MAIGLDQVVFAASQLGKNRLKEPLRTGADIGEIFLRRALGNTDHTFVPAFDPGTRHVLQAANSRDDPLMNFRWYCDLPPLWTGSQLSWEFVEEAQCPTVEFDQVSNYRAGKMYHYAGHFNLGNLSLKFYEDSNGTASTYCEAWRSLILDKKTGTYQFPSIYKKIITITILDVANMTVMFFRYLGCWLLKSSAIPLSSSNSDRVVIDAEFSVDDLEIVFGKFEDSAVPSIVSSVGGQPGQLQFLPSSLPSAFSSLGSVTSSGAFQNLGLATGIVRSIPGVLGG